MLRSLLLLLVILLLTGVPAATAQTTCATALADGQNAYDDARFDDAVRVLERCMAALPVAEQRTAYRLMALSHLGNGNQTGAQDAVRNLLRVDPGYRTDPATDPPAFARLVQDVRASGPATVTSMPSVTSFYRKYAVEHAWLFRAVRAGLHVYHHQRGLRIGFRGRRRCDDFAGLRHHAPVSRFSRTWARRRWLPRNGDNYTHSEVGLGLRYHFGSAASKLRPYVQISGVQQTATFPIPTGTGGSVDVDVTGVAGRLGGGVLYFFSPTLALHGELNVSSGEYSEVSAQGETGGRFRPLRREPQHDGVYFRVGITAFPFR